jgi:hypothetical protein
MKSNKKFKGIFRLIGKFVMLYDLLMKTGSILLFCSPEKLYLPYLLNGQNG